MHYLNKMEFEEIQDMSRICVENRYKKVNVVPTSSIVLNHITEEVGEIALQLNNQTLKRKAINFKNLGEEISESLMLLIFLAHQNKINLEDALLNTIEDINKR